jgi:L-malate glycosyltransferase
MELRTNPGERVRSDSVSPVRVCFLIDELTSAGTETQLLALIRHLDRSRVKPYLCLLRGQDERSRRWEPENCPILRLDVRSFRHPSTLMKAWRFVRFLRRERIDVLQVYFPESTYFGVPLGWAAGVPHILRTRNNLGYWMTSWHRRLGRFCNRFIDGLVANCKACAQAVIQDEGLAADRVVVLENGVDLAKFPVGGRRSQRGDGRHIGVVANLRPVKGLEVFVQAACELAKSHPEVSFYIAGEGEVRPKLQQLAQEGGIAERFQCPGSVADVPRFLAKLDIAVLPSLSEGMSNALLEYMAAGRAIVATAVGGNLRLIEDGVTGLLVPPGDAASLTAAMCRLLDDPLLAIRLGSRARRLVEERYSREAMVRRFEEFYEQLYLARPRVRHCRLLET